jgi:hypothetical protein
MNMTVIDRARAVGTFRFIEVRLMELVAAWTPMTPEMEAKVIFGRHIWDFAQHADALGKRTFELRQKEHYTLPADAAYVALLNRVSQMQGTAERISALYETVVPGLVRRYETYISGTDPILDEPTIVIMERIVADLKRQSAQARALLQELGMVSARQEPLAIEESRLPHLAQSGAAV